MTRSGQKPTCGDARGFEFCPGRLLKAQLVQRQIRHRLAQHDADAKDHSKERLVRADPAHSRGVHLARVAPRAATGLLLPSESMNFSSMPQRGWTPRFGFAGRVCYDKA